MNEQHIKNKKTIKIIGFILLGIGLVLDIIGFITFFNDSFELFWCLFLGFPLTAFGGMLLIFGYQKEINQYTKNENTPIVKEFYQDIKPELNDFVNNKEDKICPQCGTINDYDSCFCKKCRYEFIRICPKCNSTIASDSIFCSKCGDKIDK